MSSSGFTIVEFAEWSGGVAAVPVSWLVSMNEEVKCYWLRKNASKSVRKEMPVHADWNLLLSN